MIGTQLEGIGWRQGSLIESKDLKELLDALKLPIEENIVLIVASQSCDIANNNISSDPYIEFSLGRIVERIEGNLTYGKNPRKLHIEVSCRTDDIEVLKVLNLELKAYEKQIFPKEILLSLKPDDAQLLAEKDLRSYVSWLATRYSRPAHPTAFNDRIRQADPRDKLRKKVKSANRSLSGIYVQIFPDAEIDASQNYRVNLLGLLSEDGEVDRKSAETAIDFYAEIMKAAKMDVVSGVKKASEISAADFIKLKRIYFDDLSFKDDAPLPPEVE